MLPVVATSDHCNTAGLLSSVLHACASSHAFCCCCCCRHCAKRCCMQLLTDTSMPVEGSLSTGLQTPVIFSSETGNELMLWMLCSFLCALHPSQQEAWAAVWSRIMHAGGHLITLQFPLDKPANTQGPPWPLTLELYQKLLEPCGKTPARCRS